jgi:hypothetical protein
MRAGTETSSGRHRRALPRVGLAAALLGITAASLAATTGVAAQAVPHVAAAVPKFTMTWKDSLADGLPIVVSSPVVVVLAKGPAAVVGSRNGHVYAVYLAHGNAAYTVSTGGIGIDSSPSTINGTVYFGVGWGRQFKDVGGYEAVNSDGKVRWFRSAPNPSTDPTERNGVGTGLAIGVLQGQTAVVAGSLGQNEFMLNASRGTVLTGFPWFQADTNFSTPAIADVEGIPGQNQIIEGGNTSAGFAYGTNYVNGGQIRILRQSGRAGSTSKPNYGLYCDFKVNQGVDSSPAVGDILAGSKPGIVVGTGEERANVSATDDVIAINSACQKVWAAKLDGGTSVSPALADGLGNGSLQVFEGTTTGTVYSLNSRTGGEYWKTKVPGEVLGGVVTADLGSGYQDIIVPSTSGCYILDGKTGALVATLKTGGVALENSPLVTRDPNGTLGITIAGYAGSGSTRHGVIEHFELNDSQVKTVLEAGAWPEFHHDPQLTGNASS